MFLSGILMDAIKYNLVRIRSSVFTFLQFVEKHYYQNANLCYTDKAVYHLGYSLLVITVGTQLRK